MDVTEARSAIDHATKRLVALLRSAPDPTAIVWNSKWTVADVAAHAFADAYEGYLRDDTDPVVQIHQLNVDNARNLTRLEERDIAVLADRLAGSSVSFLAATEGLDATHPMRWHDAPATVATVYGMYLGELLIHGDDIARTVKQRWSITGTEATIILEAISDVAHLFVDARGAARDAVFEVNARKARSFTYRFAAHSLTVEPRLIAAGPRPWLALSFVDRFHGY